MPAPTSFRPDPWRQLWRAATGNILPAVSLVATALYLLVLSLIPQFSPESGPMAYWSAQTRFGRATEFLYRLGLFYAGDSPLALLLLSVLGFSVLLRAVGHLEQLAARVRGREALRTQPLFSLLAELGVLFLLCGLLVGRLWGWRVEGLVGEPGTPVPGRNLTLEMTATGPQVQPPQAQVYITGHGPQVTLRALNPAGRELPILQTPRESPHPALSLCLTPRAPEASLAVLEANLVVQFQAREFPRTAVDVTIFRAPSGEQAATTTLEPGPSTLTVDGTLLEITVDTCPLVAVGRDPGLWLKGLGLLLGTAGLFGTVAPWRPRMRGIRLALALGTLGLAGWTAVTLATTGLLAHSPLHTGFAALWGLGVSGWMLRPPGRDEFSAQEEE